MTETELTDRLREAIVLDGPDIWRTNGYLQDAQQAGIPLVDALKRANEISQEVDNNRLLFQNIRARIARLALPSRSHLIEGDLNQIVNAATSLKLSADFVKNKWVPTELKRLAVASKPQQTEPVVTTPPPQVAEPVYKPTFDTLLKNEPEPPKSDMGSVVPVKPVSPVFEPPVQPPVVVTKPPIAPSPPEPEPIVRSFTAQPARVRKGETVTLAWEVENLLAVTIDDLGEGLSPQNRGWVKPAKTTDYTLFDANNNPLSTVRVEVIRPDRSGIYGVLFALALLALIYWFIKHTNSEKPERSPKQRTEQTTSRKTSMPTRLAEVEPKEEVATDDKPSETVPQSESAVEPELTVTASTTAKVDPPVQEPPVVNNVPELRSSSQTARPDYSEPAGDKPYDKIDNRTDEQGWRMARKGKRWGYLGQDDQWVIEPQFEATTPFRGNTAAVFINGQLITINRSGEQVRN